VQELKDFRQISLFPGESQTVTFELSEKDLRFWNDQKQWISEPGDFGLFIGTDSENVSKSSFKLL
jgi:beta-glucosidase